MSVNTLYECAYIAFDPYPSFKGSATHISEVYTTLKTQFSNCLLMTLEGTSEIETNHWHPQILEGNYLRRGMEFSRQVKGLLDLQKSLELVQYRDIWGGMAVSANKRIHQIFEVNGFPSIELKERYAILPKSTISKLVDLENNCLRSASKIICPSEVIANHIVKRGITARKIHMISNGTHLPDKVEEVSNLPEKFIVYFGALQPWQGINVAIKAMSYLDDLEDISLVICSSHKEKLSKNLKKFIFNLGLENKIVWLHQLLKPQLQFAIQKSLISVAPLSECERNLVQGCSPLKIFESMACQTAIIASDIPVTREILAHQEDAILIKPDRPAELARGIRMLLDNPNKRKALADMAYKKASHLYSWEVSNKKLAEVYQQLLILEASYN